MAGHTFIAVASPAVLFFSHLFAIFSPVLPSNAHASFLLFHNQISVHIAPEAAKPSFEARGGGKKSKFIQQDYECMTSSFAHRGTSPPPPECRLEGGDKQPRNGVKFPTDGLAHLTKQLTTVSRPLGGAFL